MGYRDDFYISGNIIGYTGAIGSDPTVYFLRGKEFGRITQDHPNRDNIGRNIVRTHGDYSITNDVTTGHAVEFYNTKIRHRSRNPFMPIEKVKFMDQVELVKAIARFPNAKTK